MELAALHALDQFSAASHLRTEACGMLSAVRFAWHMLQFARTTRSPQLQFASDNKSLIDKLDDMQEHHTTYPNETLTSDWDVLTEIDVTLQQMDPRPALTWVKGHQDDRKSCDELSLDAQLNVDADALAGQHATLWPICRPCVPRLRNVPAQLHINGRTITSHCSNEIRHAAHCNDLHEHVRLKNDWSAQTAEKVDWKLHESAIKRNQHRRPFVIKLCHNILPLGAVTRHHDATTTSNCAFCNHDPDNLIHMIQCENDAVKEWRAQLRRTIRDQLEKLNTRPGLVPAAMTSLEQLLAGEAIPTDGNTCQTVIDEQQSLGELNFMQGRWTKQWAMLPDEHCKFTGQASAQNTGHLWAARNISTLWEHLHQLWTMRNETLHGKDESSQESVRKRRAVQAIIELHNLKKKMLQSDHVCLIRDIPAWAKNKQSTHLNNWLKIWSPLFHASADAAQCKGVRSTKTLPNCFRVLNPKPPPQRPPRCRHARKHGTHRNPNRKTRKRQQQSRSGMNVMPTLFAGHSRPPNNDDE